MRILAIDYGEKRIGLAVSDALGITANPLTVIYRKNITEDIEQIKSIIEQKEAGKIVMGLPFNMDGTPGILTEKIKQFAEKLKEASGLDVEYCDETLTSHEAEGIMLEKTKFSPKQRKERRDKLAACLILRSYLDRHR